MRERVTGDRQLPGFILKTVWLKPYLRDRHSAVSVCAAGEDVKLARHVERVGSLTQETVDLSLEEVAAHGGLILSPSTVTVKR